MCRRVRTSWSTSASCASASRNGSRRERTLHCPCSRGGAGRAHRAVRARSECRRTVPGNRLARDRTPGLGRYGGAAGAPGAAIRGSRGNREPGDRAVSLRGRDCNVHSRTIQRPCRPGDAVIAATEGRRVIPTIEIANPLDYAAEIKDLFVAHGMPSFPDYFDRTYPAAVRSGAVSWLGRDESGRVVMHQACFPRRFRSAEREVVAGLMVNLMVATQYRAFFPALTLLRRAVQDLEARGGIDFLYADPNKAGEILLQAGRFARMGTLQRYVLPVSDRRVVLDGCIRLFHTWLRATNGGAGARMSAVAHAAQEFPLESV